LEVNMISAATIIIIIIIGIITLTLAM